MVKKKSKFIIFILSLVPGLSHLYLGFSDRALIFFALFMGICMGGACISGIAPGLGVLGPLLFFGLALVWFVALVDAFALVDQEKESARGALPLLSNRKIIAVALSIVPGAGHMYLGLRKQGAQFMGVFFFFLCLSAGLNLGIVAFVLPVVWFYSLFDAYHLLEEETEGLRPDESPLFAWLDKHPGWLGWVLIILGGLLILQRIAAPIVISLLDPALWNYLETGIVALILIAGGIMLLKGNKKNTVKKEALPCDNGE